jgi:hypothetical protein
VSKSALFRIHIICQNLAVYLDMDEQKDEKKMRRKQKSIATRKKEEMWKENAALLLFRK